MGGSTASGLMLANSMADVERYLVGGVAPPGVASSTGDISQMVKYLIANAGGKGAKVENAGYEPLPSTIGSGTNVVSGGSANTYGSYVQLRGATGNAIYVVGVQLANGSALGGDCQLMIGTGGAGSETDVSEIPVFQPGSGAVYPLILPYPIAVPAATRIAVKLAAEGASGSVEVKLLVVDQVNLVAA